jgi:hypothetical protein
VTSTTDCERARMTLMASLDSERGPDAAPVEEHLSSCSSCRRWLEDLQTMTGRLQGLSYPRVQRDLWSAVAEQIGQAEERRDLARRLWPIGGVVLGWRALQLFVDVPIAMVHPLVPIAAAVAAVWLVTGDALAIQTSAPELQKRGA